jgi:hypothetical protein
MDLLIGEGILPVMYAEKLFDGLLEFSVVFDPGEIRVKVGGRPRGVWSFPVQRRSVTPETVLLIESLTVFEIAWARLG